MSSKNLKNIGISTANLYPMQTEVALKSILKHGFKNIEIFLNSAIEVEEQLTQVVLMEQNRFKANIIAVHAFTSSYEPFLFYSKYERRLHDGLAIYEKVYKFAKKVGASYVIMHGDRASGALSYSESIDRFKQVAMLGREYGITLLLENVYLFRGSEIDYVENMKKKIGDYANFVFDVKQCCRAKLDYQQVINAMGSSLKHVHISDNNEERDCLLPGDGSMDYKRFFDTLKGVNYDGKIIIELYRDCFKDVVDLENSALFLEEIFADI